MITCKEKWGLSAKEILRMNFGLRDGKVNRHINMVLDAYKELNELERLKSIRCFSQSYEQIKNNRINKIEKSNFTEGEMLVYNSMDGKV